MFWPALLASLSLTAATGAALGAALGLTGLIILHFFAGGATFLALDAVWNAFNSFTLSAIPLFIILGEILLQSGISRRVYTALTPAFQRVPGGLAPYQHRRVHRVRRGQRIKHVDRGRGRVRGLSGDGAAGLPQADGRR